MSDKNDDNNITEMRERLTELQRENREIKDAIREIAHANVLPGIMQHGFDNVIAELRPLRDLAPRRESVPQATADAVAAMLAAMQGVALTGGSLGISEVYVPFIGQSRPQPVVGGQPNQQLYSRGIRP